MIHGRAYAGEAAGLQDALFGFGLRYALCSGHSAGVACAIGNLPSYGLQQQARTGALIAASVGNRWLYARLGDRGRRLVLRRSVDGRDARAALERVYRPAAWKAALGRIVSTRPLLRPAELRADCDCTWCRCCKESSDTTEAPG